MPKRAPSTSLQRPFRVSRQYRSESRILQRPELARKIRTNPQGPPPSYPLPPNPSVEVNPPTSSPLRTYPANATESETGSEIGSENGSEFESGEQHIATMDNAHLQPPNAGTKVRAVQQAKDMQALVTDRARRAGDEPPPYDFYELIGKGAYGRVFKGINRITKGLVAIKIIDIDRVDYEEMTSKNLKDTLQEIKILQQVKDSKARDYVNIIEEARTVHNELWIVSEYASGGSVHTLMKPYKIGVKGALEEKFIIPIARELAKGLKYIHEAGVIHRDLKCQNILIDERGRVQLCDFGVSGAVEHAEKRSTIVGTPFWMAPEIHREWAKEANPNSMSRPTTLLYGSEVDIWAYGCTVYEMATGMPPFHETNMFKLHEVGIPSLEGEEFSDELKSLISFVFVYNVQERPTADQILQHPYIADTERRFPDTMLIQLVENYYKWEQQGGARISLFNPYGAQAPDPLAPEDVDEDEDDWTFSTTDEFEKEHFGGQMDDPFVIDTPGQTFMGMNAPPADGSRFEKLRADLRKEQADRGGAQLDRIFNQDKTPYKFRTLDSDPGRPPSDLILRDFNPGAPNRETVIDLDDVMPTVSDMPSIDLGEVLTVKAHRMSRLTRDMDTDDEERDAFDMDTRRDTRDFSFPMSQPNRRTMDWKMPVVEPTKRKTMEWTFDASMAEASQPRGSRYSRRRDTQDPPLPLNIAPVPNNRQTRDFVFPPRDDPEPSTLPDMGHTPAVPSIDASYDDYPRLNSAPSSPLRTSMIDLDFANIDDDYRPSTSSSATTSTYTATDTLVGNPFDLEDQVNLSQTNNRASYHMKSQSEPNQAIPGLLTPQTYDEQGHPLNQDPHHPSMHARGVSSVSQVQSKANLNNMGSYGRQRNQQQMWEGWSHQAAFSLDESPPGSVSTSTSTEDEDGDELWEVFDRQNLVHERRQYGAHRSRRTPSQDDDPRSDADDNYASEYDDNSMPARQSRVSVGPNGRPLLDFPIPRGPDPEALLGVDADPGVMMNALFKSAVEMRDGLRASMDLLKSMHLKETVQANGEGADVEEMDVANLGTVRLG